MRLLLDTHALLWWLADDAQLGIAARAQITDAANTVFVSAASAWEIEIKRALGKLEAPSDLADVLQHNSFESLPMTLAHAILAGRLPLHHGDPFDRMLIAQAAAEQLLIVTKDAAFGAYGLDLLDARS
jgi:PIN domain nuclease of toxin-antitoxin system